MLPLRMFSFCSGNRCYASADSWHSRGVHTAGMARIHKPGWKFIGTSLNLPNETDNIGHRIFLHHRILLSFRTPKTTIHTQLRTPESGTGILVRKIKRDRIRTAKTNCKVKRAANVNPNRYFSSTMQKKN